MEPASGGREVTGLFATEKKHEDSNVCATERETINEEPIAHTEHRLSFGCTDFDIQ